MIDSVHYFAVIKRLGDPGRFYFDNDGVLGRNSDAGVKHGYLVIALFILIDTSHRIF